MLLAIWVFDLVSIAPNRIVSGEGAGLIEAVGWLGALLVSSVIITLLALAFQPNQQGYRIALVGVSLLLFNAIWLNGCQ